MSIYREHPINRDFTAEAKIDLLRQMARGLCAPAGATDGSRW